MTMFAKRRFDPSPLCVISGVVGRNQRAVIFPALEFEPVDAGKLPETAPEELIGTPQFVVHAVPVEVSALLLDDHFDRSVKAVFKVFSARSAPASAARIDSFQLPDSNAERCRSPTTARTPLATTANTAMESKTITMALARADGCKRRVIDLCVVSGERLEWVVAWKPRPVCCATTRLS